MYIYIYIYIYTKKNKQQCRSNSLTSCNVCLCKRKDYSIHIFIVNIYICKNVDSTHAILFNFYLSARWNTRTLSKTIAMHVAFEFSVEHTRTNTKEVQYIYH